MSGQAQTGLTTSFTIDSARPAGPYWPACMAGRVHSR